MKHKFGSFSTEYHLALAYRVVQNVPSVVFHSKVVFYSFFSIFFRWCRQQDREIFFDTNMDSTRRYTTQQRIKIIEAYFAKSVLLTQRQCRKDFGRNNVPDGRTIQHLVDLNDLNDIDHSGLCGASATLPVLWGICYTSCLPKFGHQTLNCLSIRYIVSAKIFPVLRLCQKNWFCGKVCLNDFYQLHCSKLSSWIHIGVKSPRPAV